MKISERDVAWAAGLLEGEACFDIRKSMCRIRDPLNMHCRLIVEMKDKDVLEKLQLLFGGTLVEVKCKSKINENWAPYFKWVLTKRVDLLNCLILVQPFMSIRRGVRIKEMIEFLESKLENS